MCDFPYRCAHPIAALPISTAQHPTCNRARAEARGSDRSTGPERDQFQGLAAVRHARRAAAQGDVRRDGVHVAQSIKVRVCPSSLCWARARTVIAAPGVLPCCRAPNTLTFSLPAFNYVGDGRELERGARVRGASLCRASHTRRRVRRQARCTAARRRRPPPGGDAAPRVRPARPGQVRRPTIHTQPEPASLRGRWMGRTRGGGARNACTHAPRQVSTSLSHDSRPCESSSSPTARR